MTDDGESVFIPRKPYFRKAPVCDSAYVVLDGGMVVFVCAKADGREIAVTRGLLLGVHNGIVYVSGEKAVHACALPDLIIRTSLTVKDKVMGLAAGNNVAVLLLTNADLNSGSSHRGDTWVEGWSFATGTRVWGPLPLNDSGARNRGGIVPASPA